MEVGPLPHKQPSGEDLATLGHRSGVRMAEEMTEDAGATQPRRRLLAGAALGLAAFAAAEVARPSAARADVLTGRFRGTVVDNHDPLRLGRLRALVPGALGNTPSGWALPSAPYAGSSVGLFTVPPQGANVWVEFEEGDPDRPVWVGGFWGEGEPPPPASPDRKVLRTMSSAITLDDSGGVTIDSPSIQIDGVASFSRSGVVTVPAGASSVTVRGVELTGNSFVMATLQDNIPGLFVRAAVPNPAAKSITVYLDRAAPRATRVAWFVLA
jgi:hypothetical protein